MQVRQLIFVRRNLCVVINIIQAVVMMGFIDVPIFLVIINCIVTLHYYNNYHLFLFYLSFGLIYLLYIKSYLIQIYDQYFLKSGNLTPPSRILHDERRAMTYPSGITNTWYHFCDSKDLINGKVLEFRALGNYS